MSDELVTALLRDRGLRVLLVSAGALAREGRRVQRAEGAAAVLFGQALMGGLLLGALQKGKERIHLQLECDGPLRGVFVDANAQGVVRGYVKNPAFALEGAPGTFRWRPALGNSGFLSVLRDQGGGDYYRSSVELVHFDLALDLESYFHTSDQLGSAVALETAGDAAEPLRAAAGVLVQPLPDGDRDALAEVRERLRGPKGLGHALTADSSGGAEGLLTTLFPDSDLERMARVPVSYTCGCSKERVLRALMAMGREELGKLLAEQGQAEVTCEFCATRYVVGGDEIRGLLMPS